MATWTSLALGLLAVLACPGWAQRLTSDSNRCVQRSMRDFRPVADSCAKFHMCTMGTLITFTCPSGSVFHQPSGSCVPEGSQFDTCTSQLLQGRDLPVSCPRGATYKKAHPQRCAGYYDCGKPGRWSDRGMRSGTVWEEYERECEYPMLFNENAKRCEHFSLVNCGPRAEPLDPCEYRVNACPTALCRPCKVRFPSCRGMPDGMNEWKGKENSPAYVVCNKQRIVFTGMCSQVYGSMVFDKHVKSCTSVGNRKFWWQY